MNGRSGIVNTQTAISCFMYSLSSYRFVKSSCVSVERGGVGAGAEGVRRGAGLGWGGGRLRERETTDRQTDRQTDRGRERERQTDRQTQTQREGDRETERDG